MKKILLLLVLILLVSSCIFEENNLDTNKQFLVSQGVALSNETVNLTFKGVTPDSMQALRTIKTIFDDDSLSLVGLDTNIGSVRAGFGYVVTGYYAGHDTATLAQKIYDEPYMLLQFDSLFRVMVDRSGSHHFGSGNIDRVQIGYIVTLHKGLESEAYHGDLKDLTSFEENSEVFYSVLNNGDLYVGDSTLVSMENLSAIVAPAPNTPISRIKETGHPEDTITYKTPVLLGLGAQFKNNLLALKDTAAYLTVLITDVKLYSTADTLAYPVNGIYRVSVESPKTTIQIADSLALTHIIDRFKITRTIDAIGVDSLRIWGQLDTLSFKLPADTLLKQFSDTLGVIEGDYVDYVVKKATLSFKKELRYMSEFGLPYTIESATTTYDNIDYNYFGFSTYEHQYADSSMKNLVNSTVLDSMVQVDVTESVKNILNLGSVGAAPTTFFHVKDAIIDQYKKYRFQTVTVGDITYLDDNLYRIPLYNSFDFNNTVFDLDVELIKLGTN